MEVFYSNILAPMSPVLIENMLMDTAFDCIAKHLAVTGAFLQSSC